MNSFAMLNPMLLAMVIPKLTAPSPGELWLGGSQYRERNAPAATPPSWETEMWRVPSSWRAKMPLEIAYPMRGQKRVLPELKYRLSSCSTLPTP